MAMFCVRANGRETSDRFGWNRCFAGRKIDIDWIRQGDFHIFFRSVLNWENTENNSACTIVCIRLFAYPFILRLCVGNHHDYCSFINQSKTKWNKVMWKHFLFNLQASTILGQYLILKQNNDLFVDWLRCICNADLKQATDCNRCLRDWCDQFL